ncbi:hypothetical protein NU10_13310 [Flavobacterium dauae]|uniref:O-antigen ligase family protein n=1 Tax=Flavobacterium dauae TaxID=1563479 RepID=UPI00101B2316|nr:O-antigen ligase family protein [Flavobacterium dauae]WLD23667.1 hypothetical protein NU10_13310 [Flavobacterium dauae]
MEIKKQVFPILFFLMILFFATYQDFPLVNNFGEIARSPIVFVAPFMLVYILSHKKIVISKYLSYWISYILYLFVLSIACLYLVKMINGSIYVFYENLAIKTLKMLVYPIVGIIFYQFIYVLLKQFKNPVYVVFHALLLLQLFTICWLVLEIYYLKKPIEFLSFIHAKPEKYWRVRLWTMEESWTGTILILLTFFPVYFLYKLKLFRWKKALSIFASVVIFISYVAVSESKGFLVLVLVCVLPLIFQFINKHKYLRNISFIFAGVILALFAVVVINLRDVIFDQFNNSITFGTRFTSIYAAIDVFLHSFIGVGYSGFVYFYPQSIETAMNSGMFDAFNLQEIKAYLSTTKALSTKSELFDNLIYGGVIYLYFFYKFFIQRYNELSKIAKQELYFLRIPLLFIILAGIVYITYNIKYEVWLFLAFLDFTKEYYYKEDAKPSE